MPSSCKVAVWTIASIVVIGAIVGSLTWAILASKGPDPPELVELDWWERTVIYQIYPRSFKDSDGDGIGDLKGITSELQHFVETGVGAIWMSPIFTSPMVDFGYDISNFYEIHYEYGTMADFEELVQKSHELGIKVILDLIPNHASTESDYFIKSEAREEGYEDFFVWSDPRPNSDNDTRLPPSNWVSQFGGSIWEWSETREQYYIHQFAVEQADLNFRNPVVKQEMHNIMQFWLEKGVDGYRIDAIPHLFETAPDEDGIYPDERLSGNCNLNPDQIGYTTQEHTRDLPELYDVFYEWREFVDQLQVENNWETKVLLAEAYANIANTMLYYGNERDGRLGAHFPFNFDFITSLSAGSNARDFAYVIQRWLSYMPQGHVANWVLGNHDNNRLPSRFRTDMVDGLNSLNLMLPGVAVTYQGEEIGMRDGYVSWEDTVDVNAINQANEDNYLDYSRDPARTPYHWDSTTSAGFSTNATTWLPVAEDYIEINLAAQKTAPRSHYKVYQSLTSLRTQPALTHGHYHVQALSENTLILVRYLLTHDTYSLVFNVGEQPDTVDLSVVEYLSGSATVYSSSVQSALVSGDPLELGVITLNAGESLIFQSAPT